MRMRASRSFPGAVTAATFAFAAALGASSPREAQSLSGAAPATPEKTLTQYCVTCHNERLKTGGFVIDPAALTDVERGADAWEKVVRKLRAQSMPPAGMPRPDRATYDALTTSLETALDRAAAAHPQLGSMPPVRRLSRSEYDNAVRDLFGFTALPKEISVDYLLPPDNISSGFDNIADLLFVSPSTLERYLDAARKISRLAVGDTAAPVLVNIYRMDDEHPQDERVDDLPFGTRGGVSARSDFPVDGTYTVKIDVAGAAREPHQIEVLVDGERAALRSIDGEGTGGGRRAAAAPAIEIPLRLSAGPHLVGATFVQHSEARDEATLRPRMRSRGTQPAIASMTISGPQEVTGPGDSPSRRHIFVCRPNSSGDETACATRILRALTHRAYRRPVRDDDIQDLLPFFESGRAEGGFDLGIERAIQRMLVSSHFLFRIERPPATAAAGTLYPVSDVDLASRLSFFLWSSIPDEELLALAEAGRLSEPATLERQVRRMLADRRSESLVTNFAAQWLYLRDIEVKRPDEILFADFDETLRAAFARETELFVDSVLRQKRSVVELLTANYTFLNERLAAHYGIPNVKGSFFRRVTLPDGSMRGGLLGQGSILTITSYATRTSPVLRGKWVLENLLSAAPPPPPADVPSLKTEGEQPGKSLTMREAMTRHRANPQCATCHARMDPIGFAMENFDGIGRWRDADGGESIDATGVFPDGTKFDGIAGLKRELARHPEQFVGTIAERLLMYALGRNLQYYDAPSVRAIVRAAAQEGNTFEAMVGAVVKSRPFVMRQR